jgi:hypothetical protein
MVRNPTLIPTIRGSDRRKPKFTPEASSKKFAGPGEIDITKANPQRAKTVSKDIGNSNIEADNLDPRAQAIHCRNVVIS